MTDPVPYVEENVIDPAASINVSLRAVNALLQCAVLTVGANTPPASPADGDRHIIGTSPTGAWAGQAGKLARWVDSAWRFWEARYALNLDDDLFWARTASGWAPVNGAEGGSYTATTYNISGVTSANAQATTWQRVGNSVTVGVYLSVTPSATGLVQVDLALPVASDLAALNDVAGCAVDAASGDVAAIYADVTNNRASLQFQASSTSGHAFRGSFSYRVV